MVRVFVSSTWDDLQPERRAVESAVHQMRETKFVGMEYFGSRGEDTRTASVEEVGGCRLFVCVVAGRYNSGIVRDEYERARSLKLPCLVYFKADEAIPPGHLEKSQRRRKLLHSFKEELRQNHTVSLFRTPEELAQKLTADIHRWLFQSFLAPALESASLKGDADEIGRLAGGVRDAGALRDALAGRGIKVGGDVVQSILVAGNSNTISLLLKGIDSLPQDYKSRVRNFLTEYLGTPQRPEPFGGREADLDELDRWLDGPGQPPYLLLAAPAGRGKSALLTRWSRRLLQRRDVAVAFLPVSARHRTNLASVVFASLTSRLAELHGEKIPAGHDTHSEIWRGQMSNYLGRRLPGGRRLLLILDGIDEAADWKAGPDLFPLEPAEGLRVVVSARVLAGDADAGGWLARLGWEEQGLAASKGLAGLSAAGIADVLLRMGVPLDRLSGRVDIVEELRRLSEGDPLLVRFYVKDLWGRGEAAARLSPEDLRTIRPGLEGYFKRWWEDQKSLWGEQAPLREPAVEAVLNVLACALGPLMGEDIQLLVRPKVSLSTWMLEDTMSHLGRFVIGDGRRDGYVFSHPRLADYLYDRLSPAERKAEEGRVLEWGAETLSALAERRLRPGEVPAYLVQYYGAYLEKAGAGQDSLLALVDDAWRRAWEGHEGTHAGFLNDVNRAWRAAGRRDRALVGAGRRAEHLGAEVRCALCHASINSLASSIPPELMAALVKGGQWTVTQGLAYAGRIPDSDRRVLALTGLLGIAPDELKDDILHQALDATRHIREERRRHAALLALVPHLRRDAYRKALAAAEDIEDKFHQTETLIALLPHLPALVRSDLLPQVLKSASQVQRVAEAPQPSAEREAGGASAPAGQGGPRLTTYEEAYEGLRKRAEASRSYYCEVVVKLAPFMPQGVLARMLEEILSVREEKVLVGAIAGLSGQLSEGLLGRVLERLPSIEDDDLRIEALAGLAPHLSGEQIFKALSLAQRGEQMSVITLGLAVLAPFLPRPLKEEAVTIALGWLGLRANLRSAKRLAEEALRRVERRGLINEKEEKKEEEEEAEGDVLERSVRAALQVKVGSEAEELYSDPLGRVKYLLREMRGQARPSAGAAEGGAASGQRKPGDEDNEGSRRARSLSLLAPHLPGPLLRVALKLAEVTSSGAERAIVLKDVALCLPEIKCEAALYKALMTLKEAAPGDEKVAALEEIAPHLRKELHVKKALSVASHFQVEARMRLLVILAPRIPESLMRGAVDRAMEIHNERVKSQVLAGLAPYMPRELLGPALAVARSIRDEEHGGRALAGLAPYLPESLLEEALAGAKLVRDGSAIEQSRKGVAPYVLRSLVRRLRQLKPEGEGGRADDVQRLLLKIPEPLLRLSLEAIREPREFVPLVRDLLSLLPDAAKGKVLGLALDIVKADWYEEDKARALCELAPHAPGALTTRLSEAVETIRDGAHRALALAGVAARLGGPSRGDSQARALELVRAIVPERCRAECLNGLARYLDVTDLADALQTARAMLDEGCRAAALGGLAPYLPEPLSAEALAAAGAMRDEAARARALSDLAPHLPEASLREALDAAESFEDSFFTSSTLVELSARFGGAARGELLQRALDATRHIEDPCRRSAALAGVAARLPPGAAAAVARRAIGLVRTTENAHDYAAVVRLAAPLVPESVTSAVLFDVDSRIYGKARASMLVALAPSLTPTQMGMVFYICGRLRNETDRVTVFVGVAPHLRDRQLLARLLELTEKVVDESNRVRALAGLAPHLPDALLGRAVAAASSLREERARAGALAALAPHLPLALLRRALAEAHEIQDAVLRAELQSKLTERLTRLEPAALYDVWREKLDDLSSKTRRALLTELPSLMPVAEALGGVESIVDMMRSTDDVERWWP